MKIYWKIFLLLNIVACSPKWQYYQKNNSDNWAKINENYKFCKIGSNQSPIDVIADFAPSDLTFNFQKSKQNNVEKERKDYVLKTVFFDQNYLQRVKKNLDKAIATQKEFINGKIKKGIFLNESRIFGICKEKNESTKTIS